MTRNPEQDKEAEVKQQRLEQALRENLKRRKAQKNLIEEAVEVIEPDPKAD